MCVWGAGWGATCSVSQKREVEGHHQQRFPRGAGMRERPGRDGGMGGVGGEANALSVYLAAYTQILGDHPVVHVCSLPHFVK